MQCNFCGSENEPDSNFCTSCGNNLKQEVLYTGKEQYQDPVQYQPMEFQVQQKLLALAATYKISDQSGREFMVAKKKIFTLFNTKIEVKSPEGVPIGRIQGNFFRTEWKLFDEHDQLHAVIEFPFFMFFTKSFRIHTGIGVFQSGNSVFGKRFDAYDPQGRLSFVVDKKLLSVRDSFKIQSDGLLSPFITCMAAVVIDSKFYRK